VNRDHHGYQQMLVSPPLTRKTPYHRHGNSPFHYSAKAVLILAQKEEKISSVAVPGLCTGVGRMQPMIAARQMFQAYKEIISGERMDFKTFAEAQKYHWNINPQGMIWNH